MKEEKWRRLEWWGVPLILAAMVGLHYGYRLWRRHVVDLVRFGE